MFANKSEASMSSSVSFASSLFSNLENGFLTTVRLIRSKYASNFSAGSFLRWDLSIADLTITSFATNSLVDTLITLTPIFVSLTVLISTDLWVESP